MILCSVDAGFVRFGPRGGIDRFSGGNGLPGANGASAAWEGFTSGDGVLGVEVHLPAAVAEDPDGGDVGVAGEGADAAGGGLDGAVGEGGDGEGEEDHAGLAHGDRGQAAAAEEGGDEVEDLLAVPGFLLDAAEVRGELPGEACGVGAGVVGPEEALGGEDGGRGGGGLLGKGGDGRDETQQGKEKDPAHGAIVAGWGFRPGKSDSVDLVRAHHPSAEGTHSYRNEHGMNRHPALI